MRKLLQLKITFFAYKRLLRSIIFMSFIFARAYNICLLVIILALEILLGIAIFSGYYAIDHSISVLTFTAIPLFGISLFELRRKLNLQRAAFIKEYVSQFFTHAELYRTFHELIYSYGNSTFEEVQRRVGSDVEKLRNSNPLPFFDLFEDLQKERKEGARIYHPALFQCSAEERRLDCLLGYFDVIAYYYGNGYLRIEDIAGSISYFLGVIRSRDVITAYFELNKKMWAENIEYYGKIGPTPPWNYLEKLLSDLDLYNKENKEKFKKLQQIQKPKETLTGQRVPQNRRDAVNLIVWKNCYLISMHITKFTKKRFKKAQQIPRPEENKIELDNKTM